jgi:hypothetical protein
MNGPKGSRRSFLLSTGGVLTSAWLAANWSGVVAASQHAAHVASASASDSAPASLGFFSVADAADVDAITAQILPGGTSAGAREAHAVFFIDRALATFLSEHATGFRAGLMDFQHAFRAMRPATLSFAAASAAEQFAYLERVDRTPFFETLRMLTILGTLSSSQYGGNFELSGWKMLGFEDRHVFEPPFGYYDRDYAGFVPYRREGKS